jgi:Protein of unknown function (DUF3048) N-terminal domain/Protein of unknown function (DUF3048) C-terminal domain
MKTATCPSSSVAISSSQLRRSPRRYFLVIRRTRGAAAASLVALLVASCGGGDAGSVPPTAAPMVSTIPNTDGVSIETFPKAPEQPTSVASSVPASVDSVPASSLIIVPRPPAPVSTKPVEPEGPPPAGPVFVAPPATAVPPPPGNGEVREPVSLIGRVDLATSRAAVVVKIDNSQRARPQFGINSADVVYEELVEGVSRFAAVFHSTDSESVGPVRSARTTDIILFNGWNRPVISCSGGNNGVRVALQRAAVVDANADANFGWYRRDQGRRAPHNLLTSTVKLRIGTKNSGGTPFGLFTFGDSLANASLRPVSGATLTFGYTQVQFTWDAAAGLWRRRQGEKGVTDHVDVDGRQIAPANVVIMTVRYTKSAADPRSPEAETVGEGPVSVLTAGGVVEGRWRRLDQFGPAELIDANGAPIILAPGQTFVELSPAGSFRIS